MRIGFNLAAQKRRKRLSKSGFVRRRERPAVTTQGKIGDGARVDMRQYRFSHLCALTVRNVLGSSIYERFGALDIVLSTRCDRCRRGQSNRNEKRPKHGNFLAYSAPLLGALARR